MFITHTLVYDQARTRESVLYNCIRKCVVRIVSLCITLRGCTIVACSNVAAHACQVIFEHTRFVDQVGLRLAVPRVLLSVCIGVVAG